MGIAVSVALVFAVTVASSSIAGSTVQVIHTIVGPANLQLRARSSDGFDERILARVDHLPGVEQAAPVLEQNATITGPHGRRAAVDVAGTDISLAILDGLAHTLPISTLAPNGIALTKTTAQQLGLKSSIAPSGGTPILLSVRGESSRLKVAAVLGQEAVGALSQASAATMPLHHLQRLTGLRGRISRILVEAKPVDVADVRARLLALAAGRLTVAPADQDVPLLRQALRPSNQASAFFAVIAGLLGFLLAFNALLLTAPERRKAIADLRLVGTRRTVIVQMVLFQGACLGVAASLIGLFVGYVLSAGFFHQQAGYLAQAFMLGGGTVIKWKAMLLPLIGGILATCVASMVPLLDLRQGHAIDAVYHEDGVPGNRLSRHTRRVLSVAAGALLATATAMFILLPGLALLTCVLLALSAVLVVPSIFTGVLGTANALTKHNQRLTSLPVATLSLRATTLRSLALASTGALALFGSVALGGARDDLLRGIEGYIHSYVAGASIWIVNPNDPTAVEPLPTSYASQISKTPGISNVRTFQAGYLDLGKRRIWIVARPSGSSEELLQNQIIEGNVRSAAARIDSGGWIAVSQQIADEYHVGVGDTLTIPAPARNTLFRIAATTTNLTWSPGAILMSTNDYRRAWGTSVPTALAVNLLPGADIPETRHAIERTLGPMNGVETPTSDTRASRTSAVAREGLSKLSQIATLLLVAAVAAIVAALTSAIWQRRGSLAVLRLSGTQPRRLRRILLIESLLMLVAASLTGAIAGIYGQAIIDGYLRHITGFPVAPIGAAWRPLEIFTFVTAIALILVTIPSWLASRVPPTLALEE